MNSFEPKDKFQEFVAAYEAEIGKFPATKPDELPYWREFVMKIPAGRTQEFIKISSKIWGDRMGSPRLGFLRRCLEQVMGSTGETTSDSSCDICDSTGMMRYQNRNTKIWNATPCQCPKGELIWSSLPKEKQTTTEFRNQISLHIIEQKRSERESAARISSEGVNTLIDQFDAHMAQKSKEAFV